MIPTPIALVARHAALLSDVHDTYGVPPEIIVAIWGIESSFGAFAGHALDGEQWDLLPHLGARAKKEEVAYRTTGVPPLSAPYPDT